MSICPEISIILPTFNRLDLLPRAIDSVLGQTYGDFELIVVDDASTDATQDFLATITDERLRAITLPANGGQANARNVGVGDAQAPLLAFQDSDDVWHADKLERQINAMHDLPQVAVVYSDMRRVNRDGSWFALEAPDLAGAGIFDTRETLYSPYGLGIQSCLIRKRAFSAVGGFDPHRRVWDDLEFFLRLLDKGCTFHLLPGFMVDYYDAQGVSYDMREARRTRLELLKSYGHRLFFRQPRRVVLEFARAARL